MPNHVTNELTASPELLDFMKGDGDFDFERLLPMPAILKGCQPHMGVIEYAKIAMGVTNFGDLTRQHENPADSFKRGDYGSAARSLEQSNLIRSMTNGPFPKDYSDKDFADFLACCRAIKETGFTYWHDFSSKHWGTKWNAYQVNRKSESIITFQTAWSTPIPVISALSEKFPTQPIRLRWADEDFGSNVGDMQWLAGESVSGGALVNESRDAKELALELVHGGELPEYYRRTDSGDIVYCEEVESK